MLKETTGAFDGAGTHDLHITSKTAATHYATPPQLLSLKKVIGLFVVVSLPCYHESLLITKYIYTRDWFSCVVLHSIKGHLDSSLVNSFNTLTPRI